MSFYVEYIAPLTTWLNQHPNWAGFFTFLISFSESLAIVGSIVPGSVTMTAVGMLIGSGVIPAIPIFIWAILGAIAGDSASYFLGYFYYETILNWWPFNKHPQMIESGQQFFEKHGGKSVFIGRFLGPLRSIIPVIAGMMRMPNSRFLVANVASGVIWSALYIVPGVILGNAATELSPALATKLLLYTLLIILLIWCLALLVKYLFIKVKNYINGHIQEFWKMLSKHPKLDAWAVMISNPSKPHDHKQISLLIFAAIFLVLFILIAINVSAHGFMTAWNIPIFSFLQSIRLPSLDIIFMSFSCLADKMVLLPLLFGLFFYFVFMKQKWEAVHWLSNGIISAILIYALKPFIHFARPVGLVQIRHGSSFPSGHTTLSIAVLGFLIYLIAKNTAKDMRRFVLLPGLFLLSCIAFSRIYLGMHWLSDIVGSIFLAGSILFLHILSYQRSTLEKFSTKRLTIIAFALLTIFTSLFMYRHFEQAIHASQLKQSIKIQSFNLWWQGETKTPLFRKSRFNNPISIFNIQWAMPLTKIRHHLQSNGWQSIDNHDFIHRMRKLLLSHPDKISLFQQLYRNNPPSYIAIKDNVVLRLWPAGIKFRDNPAPLWVGTLSYLKDEQNSILSFSKHHGDLTTQQQYPLKDFKACLVNKLNFKQITAKHDRQVLLIKPME